MQNTNGVGTVPFPTRSEKKRLRAGLRAIWTIEDALVSLRRRFMILQHAGLEPRLVTQLHTAACAGHEEMREIVLRAMPFTGDGAADPDETRKDLSAQ